MTKNLRTINVFLCGLLLLAVLVRGLIPAGFMPGEKGSGFARLVLCTPTGVSTLIADHNDAARAMKLYAGHVLSLDKNKKNTNAHPSCPYAPLLAQAVITPPVELAGLIPVSGKTVLATSRAISSRFLKPYLSQGPPQFS